jgi:hypothetical protein
MVIRKVSSGEMITKQATSGTNVIICRKYVVVARIEAPVVSENKFLCTRVREVCRPWDQLRFDTFHQFIIVGVLWSQPVFRYWAGGSGLKRDQDCKEGGQTTPSWNAPVVFEYEQLCAEGRCHWGLLHRMSEFQVFSSERPFEVLFSVSQYTSDVTVVPCCKNYHKHSFRVPETVCIMFLADGQHCSNFFGLFAKCVCTHCYDPGFVTCYWYEVNETFPIFVVSLYKAIAEATLCDLCAPWEFSETILREISLSVIIS